MFPHACQILTYLRRITCACVVSGLVCFSFSPASAQSTQSAPSAQSTPPANELVLSTQSPAATTGAFGINEAIQAGEARRRAAAGAQANVPQPLAPEPAYARYPHYRGTIGDVPIRMRLGPKPDERDSVHGEYYYSDSQAALRVAGEYDGGTFLMEESDDGTTVTGLWEGEIDAQGVVRGQWTDVFDRSRVLPFVLIPVSAAVIPPYRPKPADTPSTISPSTVPPAPPTPGPAKSSVVGW